MHQRLLKHIMKLDLKLQFEKQKITNSRDVPLHVSGIEGTFRCPHSELKAYSTHLHRRWKSNTNGGGS